MSTRWKTVGVCSFVLLALVVTAGVALAFTQSQFISFTLEGCRNNGSIILPIGGKFVCPNAAYTTGNLGKGWNELDLVPHRLTTTAGSQKSVTTDFDVYVAADYKTSGHLGYDVISEPVVNGALSDASCSVSPGLQSTRGDAANPFGGGTDTVIYRQLTIHQNPGTTCVFDYYQRLALGAHLYPGSSLQSYMFDQEGLSGSKKTISIPVNEILPQELSKTMYAQQDVDHIWLLSKAPTPAHLDFGNTCSNKNPTQLALDVKITWTKGAATPAGLIQVDTYITAKNPASRTITVNVTDVIYSGATPLDTVNSGDVDVPPNTSKEVLHHTFFADNGTTDLNDIATATYTDKITSEPVPGTTTATASADVQTGDELNTTAGITDSEWITGKDLDFKVAAPSVGSFTNYTAGDWITGPVDWESGTQSSSGSVTFNKTVRVSQGVSTTGDLKDTATLTTSGNVVVGPVDVDVDIQAEALGTLTITKTIPDILNGSEAASFTFHVYADGGAEVGTGYTITFAAGDPTTKSVSVSNLPFGDYKVTEDTTTGWKAQDDQMVDLDSCSASVQFDNVVVPASAKVKKVTDPAGFEAGWTFDLKDGQGNIIGKATTTGAGYVAFSQELQSGSYSIVEDEQPGWVSDGGSAGCTFTVDLPTDAGKEFACTFTNTYQPSIKLTKKGDELSKIGDTVQYTLKLENTSSTGGAAGAPDLACTISDPTIGFSQNVALAAGSSDSWTVPFVIPADADDPFVNTATADCTYPGLATVVATSQDSWSTNLFQPSIKFDKSADTTLSKVGDVVNYTLTLDNTSSSDSPDLVCTITDKMLGVSKPVTLAHGAQDVTTVAYTVKAGDADPLENTASVSCSPVGFPNVLTASDQWSVNLFQPSVKITKIGPAYSKAGDTAVYNVTIENTSSSDAPDLVFDSFADSLVAGVVPPAACDDLASGASCSFSYSYVVQAGDPDPLVNTATVHFHPLGYTNDITSSSKWSTDLLHPAFTASKVCKANTQPILQSGPAVFTITINNTGDADLHVVPSEGAAFNVAAGHSYSYDYSIDGPFTDTVNNTVTGTVTLAKKYGLSNSYTFSASGSCIVQGKAKVIKTISGQPPAAGQTFTFEIRKGATTQSAGTILETAVTNASGIINFSTSLVPGQTYQICEQVFPGWSTNLSGDSPLFVPGSMLTPTLPNPDVNNLSVCTDFTVTSGQTRAFTVDNTPPPGGNALTIGFWKNWASCTTSSAKKKWYLDLALGTASAQTTNPPGGLVLSAQSLASGWPNYGPAYYLVLKGDPTSTKTSIKAAVDCNKAVKLLSKMTIDGKQKKASDPLFNMTAQLLAAELNRFSGAKINSATITNINRAVLLLGKYKFNGLTYSPALTAADKTLANCLATQLNRYNNNQITSACP